MTGDFLCEAFALVGLPAWVIDDACVVQSANSLTLNYNDRVRERAGGKLHISDIAAAAMLRDAMRGDDEECSVRSFPVKDSRGSARDVLHVFPIRGGSRARFPDCAAVVIITSIAPPAARPELLQSVYGLTRAEAEVARRLVMGSSIDHISVCNGTSPNTVRSQLRKVLEKTGCNRQAEAVALLSAFSGFSSIGNGAQSGELCPAMASA
ncbi:MAG: helix-turn-helix transcriptional regulator [Methylocystis sp.]|nr:helix-turn-helix transcriptional regulator [Methylocystis sp.]